MKPKLILNKSNDKYAIVVSGEEVVNAIKERIHRDPGPIPKGQVPLRYESPLNKSNIPFVIDDNKGPWYYDFLPERVVELWSINEEEFNKEYENVKNRSKFLEDVKKEFEKEKVKSGYDKNSIEDKLKNQ